MRNRGSASAAQADGDAGRAAQAIADRFACDENARAIRALQTLPKNARGAEIAWRAGTLLYGRSRYADAERCYRIALAIDPQRAEFHNDLGACLRERGRLDEALAEYLRAIELRPDFVAALNNAGVVLLQTGNAADALCWLEAALAINPDHCGIHCNAAAAFEALGRNDRAEAHYRRALALDPRLSRAALGLAALLRRRGNPGEAAEVLHDALERDGAPSELRFALGNALVEDARYEEAIAQFGALLATEPTHAEALASRGLARVQLGRYREALADYRRAAEIAPRSADIHLKLGALHFDCGRLEQALEEFRAALAADPSLVRAQHNIVFALNYLPGADPSEVFAEHRRFEQRFAPGDVFRDHPNPRDPDRRLRIGYLSADFREHPVGRFIAPVLANHDRSSFEVFCYYTLFREDALTAQLRSCAQSWRAVYPLSDAALAQQIYDDGIDIAIDLGGHTAHNRLLALARKPAPVQATWLGYLNTTGLAAIDFRISDAVASPPGMFEALHAETLIRLPVCQWCYAPPPESPAVSAAPCTQGVPVTFGAFHNPAKINAGVIERWCELLRELRGARLLVIGRGLPSIAEEFRERFVRHGVSGERIVFEDFKSFRDYLDSHRRVDLMLDTLPYPGGTTTCHALWMGVPVVTLTGATVPSRGGASILRAAGLDELVTSDPEAYVRTAAALAEDRARLAELRSTLRERIAASPLMDAARFTRDLEALYRAMWRKWCEQSGASTRKGTERP